MKEKHDIIARELPLYKEELAQRTQSLVLNNRELLDDETLAALKAHFEGLAPHVVAVSAELEEGIEQLKELLAGILEETSAGD